MREQAGDLFELLGRGLCANVNREPKPDGFDAICIPTNGIVLDSGAAVMGKGLALQAKERWPGIDFILGRSIQQVGNIVQVLTGDYGGDPRDRERHPGVPMLWDERFGGSPDADGTVVPWHIVAFPTKHHWRDPASLPLIQRSAERLVVVADRQKWRRVALPRPGCGAGGLAWPHVKPLLACLDDRFVVVYRG